MSIIHEALKKAEREREPAPTGLRLYGIGRTARRRWHWRPISGMLVGLTMVGAVSTWLWLQSQGEGLPSGTATPAAQGSPAMIQGGEDRAVSQPAVSPLRPIAVGPSDLDNLPSAAAPISPTVEAQDAGQTAFERAREAEFYGQWEEAKRFYRQALALNPTWVEARNNLGTLYVRQQQLTAAIDEFQAAVRLDPHYAIARNNLGSAYVLSGQEARAVQEFFAALHIDGGYVSPLYNLASVYARRGDVGQAVAFLTRALVIEPAVLSWLQEDADFDSIKAAPEMQRLLIHGHAQR
jgi:tetratricopeptide (TPR) repeat protein